MGDVTSKKTIGTPIGTSICVSELFAVVPVRREDFKRNCEKQQKQAILLLQQYAIAEYETQISITNEKLDKKGNLKKVSLLNSVPRRVGGPSAVGPRQQAIEEADAMSKRAATGVKEAAARICGDNLKNSYEIDLMHPGTTEVVLADDAKSKAGSSAAAKAAKSKAGSSSQQVQPAPDGPSDGRKESKDPPWRLYGLVSTPEGGRSVKNLQYFFVNRRPAGMPKKLSQTLNECFRVYNSRSFPAAILNLEIAQENIDVNVTPDKRTIFLQCEDILAGKLRAWMTERFSGMSGSFSTTRGASSVGRNKIAQHMTGGGAASDMGGGREGSLLAEQEEEEEVPAGPSLDLLPTPKLTIPVGGDGGGKRPAGAGKKEAGIPTPQQKDNIMKDHTLQAAASSSGRQAAWEDAGVNPQFEKFFSFVERPAVLRKKRPVGDEEDDLLNDDEPSAKRQKRDSTSSRSAAGTGGGARSGTGVGASSAAASTSNPLSAVAAINQETQEQFLQKQRAREQARRAREAQKAAEKAEKKAAREQAEMEVEDESAVGDERSDEGARPESGAVEKGSSKNRSSKEEVSKAEKTGQLDKVQRNEKGEVVVDLGPGLPKKILKEGSKKLKGKVFKSSSKKLKSKKGAVAKAKKLPAQKKTSKAGKSSKPKLDASAAELMEEDEGDDEEEEDDEEDDVEEEEDSSDEDEEEDSKESSKKGAKSAPALEQEAADKVLIKREQGPVKLEQLEEIKREQERSDEESDGVVVTDEPVLIEEDPAKQTGAEEDPIPGLHGRNMMLEDEVSAQNSSKGSSSNEGAGAAVSSGALAEAVAPEKGSVALLGSESEEKNEERTAPTPLAPQEAPEVTEMQQELMGLFGGQPSLRSMFSEVLPAAPSEGSGPSVLSLEDAIRKDMAEQHVEVQKSEEFHGGAEQMEALGLEQKDVAAGTAETAGGEPGSTKVTSLEDILAGLSAGASAGAGVENGADGTEDEEMPDAEDEEMPDAEDNFVGGNQEIAGDGDHGLVVMDLAAMLASGALKASTSTPDEVPKEDDQGVAAAPKISCKRPPAANEGELSPPRERPPAALPAPPLSTLPLAEIFRDHKPPPLAEDPLADELPIACSLPNEITFGPDGAILVDGESVDVHEEKSFAGGSGKNSAAGLVAIPDQIGIDNLAKPTEQIHVAFSKEAFAEFTIHGQFNHGFILASFRGELFILDQHACDEKRRFEALNKSSQIQFQTLVQPLQLTLSPANEQTVLNNLRVFAENGFSLKVDMGAPPGKRVRCTALPSTCNSMLFGEKDIEELICVLEQEIYQVPDSDQFSCAEVLMPDEEHEPRVRGGGAAAASSSGAARIKGFSTYRTGEGVLDASGGVDISHVLVNHANAASQAAGERGPPPPKGEGAPTTASHAPLLNIFSHRSCWGSVSAVPRPKKIWAVLASRACRSAIMIGKRLTPKDMRDVVGALSRLDQPWNCPHGRPTLRHLANVHDSCEYYTRED